MKEDYVIYEYTSINVKSELEPMYIDCYENFGWIPINNNGKRDYYINVNPNLDIVNIKFKRNRKIKSKEELKKLQEECEKAFLNINKLEKQPQSIATMYALIIAFIATIFMAISVFAITGEKIVWIPAILGGIIGVIGWIIPYFVYRNVREQKLIENKIKIEEQQEIIYNTCERARKILVESEI